MYVIWIGVTLYILPDAGTVGFTRSKIKRQQQERILELLPAIILLEIITEKIKFNGKTTERIEKYPFKWLFTEHKKIQI